jgi:hypothetical protein
MLQLVSKCGTAMFCFEDVDVLVTSNLVEESIINEIEMMGVKVIISQLG